jgi:hypothetical protein
MMQKAFLQINKIWVIMSPKKSIENKENASIRILKDQPTFYATLKEAVCNSKTEVMFIHLDPEVATQSNSNDGRVGYFDSAHEYVRTHSIHLRRIISIPNENKLEWTKNLIENTKDIATMDFAYVKIDPIEKSFPETVISFDIIDNDRLFLMNPNLNYIPLGRTFPYSGILDIECEEAVKVYKEYFERLWTEITKPNSKSGCYLKKGLDCSHFDKNLKRIKADMANQ